MPLRDIVSCALVKVFIAKIPEVGVRDGDMNFQGVEVCGRWVSRLEVVGRVMSCVEYAERVVFHLDDSTGVMACNLWLNSVGRAVNVGDVCRRVMSGIRLGDLVRVEGRMSTFRHRELNVERVEVLGDVHAELLHWVECMRLYKRVYSKFHFFSGEERLDDENFFEAVKRFLDSKCEDKAEGLQGFVFTASTLLDDEFLMGEMKKHLGESENSPALCTKEMERILDKVKECRGVIETSVDSHFEYTLINPKIIEKKIIEIILEFYGKYYWARVYGVKLSNLVFVLAREFPFMDQKKVYYYVERLLERGILYISGANEFKITHFELCS